MTRARLAPAAAAFALVVGALVGPDRWPNWPGFCPLRRLTGWPCPGCGLSHAFCALCRGRFVDAWHANPFGLVFFAAAIVLAAWPLVRRWRFVRGRRFALPGWSIALLVGVMWLWDAFRIAGLA